MLAAISVAVFYFRRRRYLVTGWLWYLVMLAPVIGILQVGSQAHADRYTYLPHIGLYLLLTWAAADLIERWRYSRLVLGTLAIGVVMALALAAHTQASYWQNSETLWRRALACTTRNSGAEQNLGQAIHEKGNVEEAIAHFQNALLIDPSQATVHSALGVALLEMGARQQSLSSFRKSAAKSIRTTPTPITISAIPCSNLGAPAKPLRNTAARWNSIGTMSKPRTTWPGSWPPVRMPRVREWHPGRSQSRNARIR